MPQMVVPESTRGQEGPDEAPGGVLKRKVSYFSARMHETPNKENRPIRKIVVQFAVACDKINPK